MIASQLNNNQQNKKQKGCRHGKPPEKGLSRGLIGKLRSGLDKSTVFRNALTGEVDRFVKTAPNWPDASVKLLEKLFQDFVGIFFVSVNYDEPEAIARAIDAIKVDAKSLNLPLAEIPLVGSGQVVREVREVHFGRVMYNRDLPQALEERGKHLGFTGGFIFADPLTALRFACANSDRQRKYPLAILFTDSTGQLCSLCLNQEGRRGRGLCFDPVKPDGGWSGSVRFLAVCKLALAT